MCNVPRSKRRHFSFRGSGKLNHSTQPECIVVYPAHVKHAGLNPQVMRKGNIYDRTGGMTNYVPDSRVNIFDLRMFRQFSSLPFHAGDECNTCETLIIHGILTLNECLFV
jgi:hypothetical protein